MPGCGRQWQWLEVIRQCTASFAVCFVIGLGHVFGHLNTD
jgi:hypothetical protein